MTDADLNEAIRTAWHVVRGMSPARTRGEHIKAAEDHLAHLMEAQRQRVQIEEQVKGPTSKEQVDSLLAATLQKRLEEANRCNENQRRLIKTLRERSATALIQRIRNDMAAVEKYQSSVTFEHLRQILDAYERRLGER